MFIEILHLEGFSFKKDCLDQAERQRSIYRKDWIDKRNAFVQFKDYDILENAGKFLKAATEKIAVGV
ncbi:hypothetical protein [Aquibacillus koreensis]|uniref:hypothetical protein n=1 Tax=Aquibacillus koreensis TaxID=279446 RepID=UPI002341805D|nr:hypothetical protein [Aquibacillus koreensis]